MINREKPCRDYIEKVPLEIKNARKYLWVSGRWRRESDEL